MALKLKQQDQEFRNPLIFHGDAKTIALDRVLLNLFMLIKYNGLRPKSRIGRKDITIKDLVKRFVARETDGDVEGFSTHEEQVHWWVITNLVDLVNRGNPEKEALASLKAIHLDSYKYRNPRHARDYNISEQVYAMLQEDQADVIDKLRKFLEQGWDHFAKAIEHHQHIDLDTLGILKIVEKMEDSRSSEQFRSPKCICPGQSRMFADDVRRLLIYQNIVPRHVLLDYLKTIIGLHVGLYLFKLFRLLPDWAARGERHSVCQNCPVYGHLEHPFQECPYQNEFIVDCGDNPKTGIAKMAEEDATFLYARIHDYIRATFSLNMALQYCQLNDRRNTEDLDAALASIKERGVTWDVRFNLRKEDLLKGFDEEQATNLQPILELGLPPFETFIELIMQARGSFHFRYNRELLDSLFQKNRENGLIWKGRSRRHNRRFWLSSRLLETMVQLAVLKSRDEAGKSPFYSEPILIEHFLGWLQQRYGFIINGVDHKQYVSADISVHQAFRENVAKLKHRLREIGFFNVLSDAYIMQRIRPRYPIE